MMVARPNIKGILEIMVGEILTFMWSFGALSQPILDLLYSSVLSNVVQFWAPQSMSKPTNRA